MSEATPAPATGFCRKCGAPSPCAKHPPRRAALHPATLAGAWNPSLQPRGELDRDLRALSLVFTKAGVGGGLFALFMWLSAVYVLPAAKEVAKLYASSIDRNTDTLATLATGITTQGAGVQAALGEVREKLATFDGIVAGRSSCPSCPAVPPCICPEPPKPLAPSPPTVGGRRER